LHYLTLHYLTLMPTSTLPRRRALFVGIGVLLAALGATQVAAGRQAPAQTTAQLPMAMVESVMSETPTVSADGRWVVYAGVRELAVGDQSNAESGADEATSPILEQNTIWLKDLADDSVIDLTPTRDNVRAGRTVWPVISGDGCTVTVITELALDLFRDDDLGERWDVYRVLLPHCDADNSDADNSDAVIGDWELVSATDGSGFDVTAGDDASPLYPPAVSADGNLVAYTHQFEATTSAELLGVTVVDLTIAIGDAGRATPVLGTPAAVPESVFRHRGLREPTISADGYVLAFTSDAISDAALPEWGVGLVEGGYATSNIYVWDRTPPVELDAGLDTGLDTGLDIGVDTETADDPDTIIPGTITAISTVATGATGDASSPALSGNGRFVAFVSTATNLVPGATLPPCGEVCVPQVYLFDRTAAAGESLRLASRVAGDPLSPPVAADAGATQPALNYNGDELLFVSRSRNLFPTRSLGVGDAADGDIVLALPSLGTIERMSVLADGIAPAPAANSHPRISAVGRVVVFDTLAGSVYGTPDPVRATGRQVAIVQHAPTPFIANLDFGTVAVWFPGPEWFLVLSNNGPSAFLPATAEVDDEQFLISGGSCLAPAVAVPAGGTCTIELMMLPTAAGEIKGTLTVSEVGFNAVSVSAELTGRGGEPSLAPTPAGAHGGSILVGASSEPMSFSVGNVSFGSVKVKSVVVAGSHPDDFSVTVDNCSETTLGAGATDCELQVVFTPTAGGRRSAQIVVNTRDGGYATMLLSGDAFYEPQLAVAQSTLAAGSRLEVSGSGFAPNVTVTLLWADGSGGSATAVTDAAGGLNAKIVVRATDRSGLRTLVAQALDQAGEQQVAAAEVLILAPTASRGPSSPAWPGT